MGVMLDLAQHQDDVVGWIESWTSEGDDERDYFLGALIESMTQLDEQGLDAMVANSDHPAIVSMRQDLEAMPESDRSKTQSALLAALRQLEDEARPGPNDASLPLTLNQGLKRSGVQPTGPTPTASFPKCREWWTSGTCDKLWKGPGRILWTPT